jgi:hypothetical protein
MHFLRYEETLNALGAFLADRNMATCKAKTRILIDIAALVKNRPENTLPDGLIKVINSTHIDSRYLEKEVESIKFHKKKMTKKLYRQQAAEKKKEGEKYREQKAEKGSGTGTLEMKAKIKKDKTKQKMKVKEEVDKEFAEGQATLKKKDVVKSNSALLQEIYYIYFKLLTERPNSKFLPDVL